MPSESRAEFNIAKSQKKERGKTHQKNTLLKVIPVSSSRSRTEWSRHLHHKPEEEEESRLTNGILQFWCGDTAYLCKITCFKAFKEGGKTPPNFGLGFYNRESHVRTSRLHMGASMSQSQRGDVVYPRNETNIASSQVRHAAA
ncbi:hypothetical protein SK128_026826 [Halocaridina rubra]|uniref:Uncharacterized protein n=1 Tax=Halocaridina rubra TaxID=373956 RepID=A0AAN8X8S7_HALRR